MHFTLGVGWKLAGSLGVSSEELVIIAVAVAVLFTVATIPQGIRMISANYGPRARLGR